MDNYVMTSRPNRLATSGVCAIALLIMSLCAACNDDGQGKHEDSSLRETINDDRAHAATNLVAMLKLTRHQRAKFMEKLVGEIGEKAAVDLSQVLESKAYRRDLAAIYAQTFTVEDLTNLKRFAGQSLTVRLSMLSAPHTLSQIPGMGGGPEAEKETRKKWAELKEEVEFFAIETFEAFRQEVRSLQGWDTQPFLREFDGLKKPVVGLINRHLSAGMFEGRNALF